MYLSSHPYDGHHVRPNPDAVPRFKPKPGVDLDVDGVHSRGIVQRGRRQAGQGTEVRLRRTPAACDYRLRAEMTIDDQFTVPKRIWFANTDMQSFNETGRDTSDNSAFAYWLAAGRLYVTPNADKPRKYQNALDDIQPGDPVMAYEDGVGFVGIGWVCNPKDLRRVNDNPRLYPKPAELVRSLAVDWDTSVQRSAQHVEEHDVIVSGYALRESRRGELYEYLLDMLKEGHACRQVVPDVLEKAVLERIRSSPAYDATTRAQLIEARVGQGRFRKAVLEREPACRLTGIRHAACLVASHIKPWRDCDDRERLDGANGLMLSPHVDHLFDTGQISFSDEGYLLLAPSLDTDILRAWHIDADANVGPFAVDQTGYLAYHRRFVFGQLVARRHRNLVGDVPDSAVDFDDAQGGAAVTAGAG